MEQELVGDILVERIDRFIYKLNIGNEGEFSLVPDLGNINK